MYSEPNNIDLKKVFDRGIINIGNKARIVRVMNKAEAGKAIKIGFIGGSITAGALAGTPEKCYAYLTYEWWKDRFPLSQVSYINAGVGATTSQFGAARVSEELLIYEPDVVFAEFSVNDSNNEFYKETFEGLVRRILLYKTEPALIMFNNVFYDDGHNAQDIHNEIGRYYDLSIASMKESIYAELGKGTIDRSLITPDNLHPNNLGHSLVAGLLTNLLDTIYSLKDKQPLSGMDYRAPERAVTRNRYYVSARLNNKNTLPVLRGFVKDKAEKAGNWDIFRYGWYGRRTGDSISFEVTASIISIQYRKYAKHPSSVARLVLDKDEDSAITLDADFEETWGDCLYLQDIASFGEMGRHTIDITVTGSSEERPFYLASIITA